MVEVEVGEVEEVEQELWCFNVNIFSIICVEGWDIQTDYVARLQ